MHMKKSVLIFAFFILLVTSLHAKYYKDKGLSGKLAFSSRNETFTTKSVENTQNDFMQEYGLRYQGNIYNPKLIDYDLSAVFRFNDIKYNGVNSGNTDLDSTDYNLNINFLGATSVPFTIYARKTDRPTTTIYYDSRIKLQEANEKKGLRGLIKLSSNLNIDYEIYDENYIRENETKTLDVNNTIKEQFQVQQNDIRTYKTALRYTTRKNNMNLRFQQDLRDILTLTQLKTGVDIDVDSVQTVDNTLRFNSRTEMSPDFVLSTFANYTSREIWNSETLNANVNLDWVPKGAKYNGAVSISFDRAKFSIINDLNASDTNIQNFNTDLLQFRQKFNYKITRNFVIQQVVNLTAYDSNTAKGQSDGLNLRLNYTKRLNSQTKIRAAANIDAKNNHDEYTTADTNISALSVNEINEILYTYDASTGILQAFPFIFSKLDISFRYSGRDSSLNKKSNNYVTALSLNSSLWKFTNSFNSSYTASDNMTSLKSINTTSIHMTEKFNFSSQLWTKGRIFTSVGYRYDKTDSNILFLYRKYITSNINFNYRFFNSIDCSINANLEKETVQDQIIIQEEAKIRYTAGKTEMALSYRYNKTGTNLSLNTARSIIEATLVRRF